MPETQHFYKEDHVACYNCALTLSCSKKGKLPEVVKAKKYHLREKMSN